MFCYDSEYIATDSPIISKYNVKIRKRLWAKSLVFVNHIEEKYKYSGTLKLSGLHNVYFLLTGINVDDDMYILFEKGLKSPIEKAGGIGQVIHNDDNKHPIAMKFYLTTEDLDNEEAKDRLGKPNYITI